MGFEVGTMRIAFVGLLATGLFTLASSSIILTAVRFYFEQEPALHAYLCRHEDAFQLMRLATEGRSINARHISLKTEVAQDMSIGGEPVHRKGILVDMRCSEGKSIIERVGKGKVTGMFNASFTWLLWTDEASEAIALLKDSRVSIDTKLALSTSKEGPLVLMDVYRNHVEGSFIATNVTVLGANDSDSWSPPSRNNFNGYKFKASTVLFEFPFRGREDEEVFMNPNYLEYVAGFRRYGYAMLYLLSSYYNFDFEMKVYDRWHTIYPNGTATGMLKDLISGDRDFGMAASKYIGERLKIVSFLGVLGSVTFFVVFRQPVALGSVNALVAPMSFGAWFGFFGACAVCGFVLWVLAVKDSTVTEPHKWNDSYLITLSTVAQQSIEYTGSKLATRIALLALFMMTFIANILYNTSVLNGLLIKAPDAIQNAQQLLASDLKISCNNVGYLRDQMEANDSLTRAFKEKLLRSDKVFINLEEGVRLVKSGRYAFYVLDDDFYRASSHMLTVEEICTTSDIRKERSFPTGIYGVHNSPYREHFRRGLTYLLEIGILSHLSKAFRASKPECMWSLEAEPFGVKPLTLAYIVFCCGFLLSLIILSSECLYSNALRRGGVKKRNADQQTQQGSGSATFVAPNPISVP